MNSRDTQISCITRTESGVPALLLIAKPKPIATAASEAIVVVVIVTKTIVHASKACIGLDHKTQLMDGQYLHHCRR